MLTISKPLSSGQAQNYHSKEFTSKEQNYWSQRGVIQGEWQGQLASRFGLSGAVSAEDFARLSQGQHPQTGEQIVRQRASYEYVDENGKTVKTMEHRAGWDATFSAPKSVSLTALVGGDENVRIAHRVAVKVALEQLEMYTQARIGGNQPAESTAKLIAAKFEHDTARPVDGYVAPQLHTHAVFFNVTERENGQFRAVQPQSLFASQQFATAVYQSELTYHLRQLGYEITTGRSGAPEIKGYTQEYLDASSPRSQQIREYLERTGRTGSEAAEIAAHSTRDKKAIHSPREVMAAHRKLAADFGHQAEAVVREARERLQRQQQPAQSIDRVRESLTFARDKNFEREAVVDERALIRDSLRRGMGEVRYSEVRNNLNARLASGEFQIVDRQQHSPARQFTTARTIAAEQEIVHRVSEGRNQIDPVLSRQQAIAVADQYGHLNRAQKSVVEDVLSSPDRIQGIQGYAGAGKTTALSVIRSAAESEGYAVRGFAPTSRAARQLNEAGVTSETLQKFLVRPIERPAPAQRNFYFVDESSLASTNQMREFLARLGPQDRVLLIGDTRQHQGVEAGRPFEQLQEAGMRTARLDEIVRQRDPELKSAVEMLAKGQASAALESLQQQGRVREIPNAEERIRTIAKAYAEVPAKTLIVSPDNASRRELNVAVREELKAHGIVAADDRNFRVLVQRRDMTGAERTWASHYETGDIVRFSRGSKALGIEAGSYGSVVGVNSAANLLSVEKVTGEIATYDPRRLTGVSVYREIDREFSAGDRIQFTAPDKALGVANRDLAVIDSIAPDGRISVRLESGREINFDPAEHRHFDHGYAVTSHSAQGLTAERVLVNVDTSVHPDLLNSRFGYVSISRASHEATLFTDNLAKLNPQLSADISKSSALEMNQGSSIAPEINVGMNM
ncbi:MobF family relaxase [Pseudacidobacterium ailaaui]|jgi:conjugative relaxase-like TrwC/TraI family protein|uniref:MobF family relaxase n=1 Tax=Pseudacidobacterium ailaaui TaxID=1382359 RepID=UPI0005D27B6C|nr:MobF family relaxase [Pseudacidobacterium ailaaui]